MCGLIYSHDFTGKPVNNAVLDQYDKQKLRGTQGFGIFDGQEGNIVHESKENRILKWLVRYDSSLLLLHHRYPTSTINVKRAAHPFSTKDFFGDTQYILVHNGSIRNAEDLFEEHVKQDIDYYSVLQDLTFNDSESLLWDFALYMEGKQDELKVKGGVAFIALKLVKGKLEKMYFARNASKPLKMLRTKEGISLASELKEGEDIDVDTLHTWNYDLKRLTKRKMEIPQYLYTYSNYKASDYRSSAPNTADGYDATCRTCIAWNMACSTHYKRESYVYTNDGKGGNILTRNFGKKFGVPDNKIKTVGEVLKEQYEDITYEEVTQEYMAYLAGCKGRFEDAYWMIEGDYEAVLEYEGKGTDSERQKLLLEKVLARIESDPEFTDGDSISSIWEALWKQAIKH